LVDTTADQDRFSDRYAEPTRDNVLQFLSFDEENPNSILSCVSRARENARSIREIIPGVVWEQLNKFFFMVRSDAQFRTTLEQPQEFCERVRLASHTLVGALDGTMAHDEAWHFARLGRLLERADKTSRIVDVQYYLLLPNARDVGNALDVVRWSALLKSASALEAYRRKYGKIVPRRVAELLILDRHFPRSMHFGVIKALDSLRSISGSDAGTYSNHSEQLMGRLRSMMDYADISDILRGGLHEFIDDFQSQLNAIGAAVHQDFFTLPSYPVSATRSAMSHTQN
jgi:uncharacterized alpha-E superfamily protein